MTCRVFEDYYYIDIKIKKNVKRDLFEALLVPNEVELDVSIISSGFNEGVEFRRTAPVERNFR